MRLSDHSHPSYQNRSTPRTSPFQGCGVTDSVGGPLLGHQPQSTGNSQRRNRCLANPPQKYSQIVLIQIFIKYQCFVVWKIPKYWKWTTIAMHKYLSAALQIYHQWNQERLKSWSGCEIFLTIFGRHKNGRVSISARIELAGKVHKSCQQNLAALCVFDMTRTKLAKFKL